MRQRNQRHGSRALDGGRQFSLMLAARAASFRRDDLSALVDKAPDQSDIPEIDIIHFIGAKITCFYLIHIHN